MLVNINDLIELDDIGLYHLLSRLSSFLKPAVVLYYSRTSSRSAFFKWYTLPLKAFYAMVIGISGLPVPDLVLEASTNSSSLFRGTLPPNTLLCSVKGWSLPNLFSSISTELFAIHCAISYQPRRSAYCPPQ